MMGALQILQETHKNGSRVCETSAGMLCDYHGDVKIITTAKS